MTNKHMKRCSTSVVIREMQIKTEMRYHLTAFRMAVIKKSKTTNAGEGVERKEPFYVAYRNVIVTMGINIVTLESSMEVP